MSWQKQLLCAARGRACQQQLEQSSERRVLCSFQMKRARSENQLHNQEDSQQGGNLWRSLGLSMHVMGRGSLTGSQHGSRHGSGSIHRHAPHEPCTAG